MFEAEERDRGLIQTICHVAGWLVDG